MGNIAPGWCRVAKDIIALRQQLIPWYGERLVKGIRSEKNYEKDDTTYGWFCGHGLLQPWLVKHGYLRNRVTYHMLILNKRVAKAITIYDANSFV